MHHLACRVYEMRVVRRSSPSANSRLSPVSAHATIVRLELAQVNARPSTVRKLAQALHVKPRDLLHTDS